MLTSFFRLSVRNLFKKYRLFTLTNTVGLAISLASVLLISLFIVDEYSFDRYHKKSDGIYRIVLDFKSDGNTVKWARTSAPIGHYLVGAYPEVEQVLRLRKNPGTDLLANSEIKFYEDKLFFADSALFKVFDISLKSGSADHALKAKNSIVINERLAKKYFADEDPVGKGLRLNNQIDLKITGVMKQMPANSHFVADAFITFSTLDDILGDKRLTHWGWMDHYTYILLSEGSTASQVEQKLPELLERNAPEWVAENEKLSLQPLNSIHLHSDLKDEITPNSSVKYSYLLGMIAMFILLMAFANFINLTTATLSSRFKEISIQKVLGAGRLQLAGYFWIESTIIAVVAFVIACIVVSLLLPYVNAITGKHIIIETNLWLIIPGSILTLLIGFFSGIIPGLQVRKLNITKLSKEARGTKSSMRTALITFQFSISIMLLIATWIVTRQYTFLKSARLGFSSQNVIVVPIKDRSQNEKYRTIVTEISRLNEVAKVSFSSSTPASNNAYTYTYTFLGSDLGEQAMSTFFVDEHFFNLYGITVKEGRLPNPDNADTLNEVVINEAAVKHFHLSEPIGQLVKGNVKGRVVGVVSNFNHSSLHSSIDPMIFYHYVPNFRFVSIQLKKDVEAGGIAPIEKEWQTFYAGYPMEYFFLNDQIERLYGPEFQLRKVYNSFAVIAMGIAGIGLIGLTTYILDRKVKEISIRKVFGGSVSDLLKLMYSGYLKIVLASIAIGWTLSYYWMNQWLNGFAFKVDLTIGQFLLPTVVMVIVLVVTTGLQTLKAAQTNPIDNLRQE